MNIRMQNQNRIKQLVSEKAPHETNMANILILDAEMLTGIVNLM